MTDQRSLRNSYKQTFVPIGVYAIRNTVNQRAFVGGARNLDAAMHRHRFELTTGSHRSADLQADWKQHGAGAFRFEVLDRVRQSVDPDVDYDAELAALLALWRDELPCFGPGGYNGPTRPAARL